MPPQAELSTFPTAGKPLSIHDESLNPALRLYHRLGFHMIEDKGVYLLMEWKK